MIRRTRKTKDVQRDQSFDPPDFYKFRANQNNNKAKPPAIPQSTRSSNSAQNINNLINRSDAVKKSTQKEEEKVELQKERDRINKLVEQHIIHQQTQLEYQKNKSRQYARDLISQHNFTNQLKQKRQELDNIEYEKGLQTEQAYESRLREVLDRVDIQQSHPLRSKAMNSGSSSNGLIF